MSPATSLFLIENYSNLHVGAGSSVQGVIDNIVQRDHVYQLPCILASSLKGSLREFFEQGPYRAQTNKLANGIFGEGANKSASGKVEKGNYIFHDAHMLTYPVRSNKEPYFNATCPMIIDQFLEFADLHIFDMDNGQKTFLKKLRDISTEQGKPVLINYQPAENNLKIEEFSTFERVEEDYSSIKDLLGDRLVVFHNADFRMITDDYNLPVIARNQLENGESKNLFYEQVVPRRSRFYAFFSNYSALNGATDNKSLEQNLHNKRVQVGANSSIGYGQCMFLQVNNQLKISEENAQPQNH